MRHRPADPGGQPSGRPMPQYHHVDEREDKRRAVGPLVPRRLVGIAADEQADRCACCRATCRRS